MKKYFARAKQTQGSTQSLANFPCSMLPAKLIKAHSRIWTPNWIILVAQKHINLLWKLLNVEMVTPKLINCDMNV